MPGISSISIEKDSKNIGVILEGLNKFTQSLKPNGDMALYEIYLKDAHDGTICGGIAMQIVYRVLYIDLIFVNPDQQDIPPAMASLLDRAHAFAKSLGCNMSTMNHMSFRDDLEFLQDQGYIVGHTLEGFVNGHKRCLLYKDIRKTVVNAEDNFQDVCHSDEDLQTLSNMVNEQYADFPVENYGVIVRNDSQIVVGGASIQLKYGSVYTDLLWLDESVRGQGIGRDVMDLVHSFGKAKGAEIATICTMSFETAYEFYKHLGYHEDYRKDGYIDGSAVIYLSKDLGDIMAMNIVLTGSTTESDWV